MKVAVFSDIHLGVRGGSDIFLEAFLGRFWEDFAMPYCLEHDIREGIIAGDLWDKRKETNLRVLEAANRRFFPSLMSTFQRVTVIPGNHDVYHSNSLKINSLEEHAPFLERQQGRFHIIMEPAVSEIGGLPILFVPWICEENEGECLEAITRTNGPAHCIGHFAINGFSIGNGMTAEGVMNPAIFNHFERVWTGHFHTISDNGIIRYLGSPYEMTWSDWNDPKGFHVLDTLTKKVEFVRNPHTIFEKVVYNDTAFFSQEAVLASAEEYKGKYVRVVVEKKANPLVFDAFIDELDRHAIECKVFENVLAAEGKVDLLPSWEANTSQAGDAWPFLKTAIEDAGALVEKDRLERLLSDLYREAQLRQV